MKFMSKRDPFKKFPFTELKKCRESTVFEIRLRSSKTTMKARFIILLGNTGALGEFEEITNYDKAKGSSQYKTQKKILCETQVVGIRFINH